MADAKTDITVSPIFRELLAFATLLIAVYSCIIGAFFAVFVPQACPNVYRDVANVTQVYYAECTFAQNVYEDIDFFNTVVLGVNLASAILLLIGFAFEFKRERFIIENLDVNPEKPDNNLAGLLPGHPELAAKLNFYSSWVRRPLPPPPPPRKNRPRSPPPAPPRALPQYSRLFTFILLVNLVNVGLSIRLIYIWYAGFRSVVTFLTNFIFLFSRLVNSILVARACELDNKAQSTNLVEPLTFNVLRAGGKHAHRDHGIASSQPGTAATVSPRFGLGLAYDYASSRRNAHWQGTQV